MIINYDHNPALSVDQKLQSLIENIHLALNELIDDKELQDELKKYLSLEGGVLEGNLRMKENEFARNYAARELTSPKLSFVDKNGQEFAYIKGLVSFDGQGRTIEGFNIGTYRKVNGSNKWNAIRLQIDADGRPIVNLTGGDAAKQAWRDALGLGGLATKDSVTNAMTVVTQTASNSVALSADQNATMSVKCKAPDGYQIVGVGAIACNNPSMLSRGFDVDGYGVSGENTVYTFWRATAPVAVGAATITVQIMCMKVNGVS